MTEPTYDLLAYRDKPDRRHGGLRIVHVFSGSGQSRSQCGKVVRNDERYIYTTEMPVKGVPCERCTYSQVRLRDLLWHQTSVK